MRSRQFLEHRFDGLQSGIDDALYWWIGAGADCWRCDMNAYYDDTGLYREIRSRVCLGEGLRQCQGCGDTEAVCGDRPFVGLKGRRLQKLYRAGRQLSYNGVNDDNKPGVTQVLYEFDAGSIEYGTFNVQLSLQTPVSR